MSVLKKFLQTDLRSTGGCKLDCNIDSLHCGYTNPSFRLTTWDNVTGH